MLKSLSLAATALALTATPAFAQSSDEAGFNGLYIGASGGLATQSNDRGSVIRLDRNGDGVFGDDLTNAAGQSLIAGYCNGRAVGPSIATGCLADKEGAEYMGRVGFDIQRGSPIVFGIVADFGRAEISDGVSLFTTTPQSYTMTRDLRFNAGLRGRLGYTPNNRTLFYATGGGAYGRVRNFFSTTNPNVSGVTNGSHDAWGLAAGGGVEQRIGDNFSIGLEYLYTSLKDKNARVQVTSTTPGSAFQLGNANGTTFRRSDDNFRWSAFRVTAGFRF